MSQCTGVQAIVPSSTEHETGTCAQPSWPRTKYAHIPLCVGAGEGQGTDEAVYLRDEVRAITFRHCKIISSQKWVAG